MSNPFTVDTLLTLLKEPQVTPQNQQVYNYTNDVRVLALTMYGEGRNQSILGRTAIGWVVKNRVTRGGWDRSIQITCLRRLQFSCWWEDGPNRDTLLAAAQVWFDGKPLGPSLRECEYLAAGVIRETLLDPTGGATHYLTRSLYLSDKCPAWVKDATSAIPIGDHMFLRGVA